MSEPKFVPILRASIKIESDIVFIRQRARQVAQLLGFDSQDQTRIATSVSEIARNAYQYAGGGFAEVSIKELDRGQRLFVVIRDNGKGIVNLPLILSGNYVSKTGMGLGIIGAKRLMDQVEIESSENGTKISLEKYLPKHLKWIGMAEVAAITAELAKTVEQSPYKELQEQNQELLATLASLTEKKEELGELNRELENTNRGVVALYAELDEKAKILKQVSEAKSSFLANMTHEFRTPVNSILNISSFLLDPEEGVTNPEHQKQVQFIRKSAKDLSDLINDLLDLSKVEAGKIEVRISSFIVSELFGSLRGLMRPLMDESRDVALNFEDLTEGGLIHTDEGKLAQILRNLISNALKYTEKGEVKVSAKKNVDNTFSFTVKDTGIGIAKEDQARIFEEFVQIDSPIQRKVKGTGLGLPLTYRLTQLLQGKIELSSEPGLGTEFVVIMPNSYQGPDQGDYLEAPPTLATTFDSVQVEAGTAVALIIDDEEASRYTQAKILTSFRIACVHASGGRAGVQAAMSIVPKIIFLDLSMPDLSGFEVLRELMSEPSTRTIPVVISSSQELSEQERTYLDEVAWGFISKESLTEDSGIQKIREYLLKAGLLNE